MVDETRSKLVYAIVIATGLWFSMMYANESIRSGDSQFTVSVTAIYEWLSSHH